MAIKISRVAIVGAGTMGLGIAQVCATSGFTVQLFDLSPALTEKAFQTIKENLALAVEKGKLGTSQMNESLQRISRVYRLEDLQADLFIEAIVEKLEPKQALMATLEKTNPAAILASNTSTFPITRIGESLNNPSNCIGLHFFNPAPIMKLVEIISSDETNPEWVILLKEFCQHLGKVAVLAKDSPGFIVNRVARPYYVEALKLLEEGGVNAEVIDQLMRATGFRMGPFELMDLIGIDTNLAVTTSLYEAFHQAPRFRPSPIQQQKVAAGHLGKKTGKGFYDYEKK